ncbi:hypothetical protein JW823_08710 [bacterium]|nr:hypothetical protein [candidate division CSSED10-310 bacterium]
MENTNNKALRGPICCIVMVGLLLITGCACHHPRTHEDLIRYGVTLAENGYWNEAGMQWRMVLNEDPNNVAALNNLGIAAEVLDSIDTASRFLNKAQHLRPDDKQIRKNIKSLQQRLSEKGSGAGHEEDK